MITDTFFVTGQLRKGVNNAPELQQIIYYFKINSAYFIFMQSPLRSISVNHADEIIY